jgi:serine phosphatase RsbU (regulator of sigma subunit)
LAHYQCSAIRYKVFELFLRSRYFLIQGSTPLKYAPHIFRVSRQKNEPKTMARAPVIPYPRLFLTFVTPMKKILNIGVSLLNDESLNRKIRISNLVSLITIVFMIIFVPLAIRFDLKVFAVVNALFLLLSAFNFVLHSRKLHTVSFVISCVYGLFYFSLGTIVYGLGANMHFFLLVMCMIAIVLFDNMVVLKIYNVTVILVFSFLVMYMKNRPGLAQYAMEANKIQELINTTNLFSLFLITIVLFVFFKRDNTLFQKMILDQKKLVQEKQKEIIDSITYARRIQEAILPPQSYWLKNLPHSFVLYKPKDIVAGDFYWIERIITQQGKDLVFFAAADCTGHGVPGAMVSVVCNNALNRSLLEFKLTDTGKILDKTRELVIATFGKSDNEVKDGMDISLCRLDLVTSELQWSGANNPLWYVRNGELIEIKPDKQPIGNYDLQTPFTSHVLQLQKGDTLYIFTDGYADQFGGIKGKKFKYKQLEEKLLAIHGLEMPEQKKILEKTFEDWKHQLEQIDDVCVMGVKI